MDSLLAIHENFFKAIVCWRLAFPSRTRWIDVHIFRIFSPKVNCNFSHVVAYQSVVLGAIFSKKFFAFCKGVAGISFEFNCHCQSTSRIQKLLVQSLWTLRLGNSNSRSLFYPHHFPHITERITLPRFLPVREHRFYRLSFRYSSSLTYLSTLLPSYPIPRDGTFFTRKLFFIRIYLTSS